MTSSATPATSTETTSSKLTGLSPALAVMAWLAIWSMILAWDCEHLFPESMALFRGQREFFQKLTYHVQMFFGTTFPIGVYRLISNQTPTSAYQITTPN